MKKNSKSTTRLAWRFLLVSTILIGAISQNAEAQRKTRRQPSSVQSMIKQSDIDYQLWENFSLVQKANSGEAPAQHELGIRYLLGKGFAADTVKAAYWIQKAASQDFLIAHYNLGIFYLNGLGVEWNPFNAYEEFTLAARRNMADAKYVLGLLLTENLIVPRDWSRSFTLIKDAADEGFEPAKKVLKEFEKRGVRIDTLRSQNEKVGGKGSKPAQADTARRKIRPIFLDFDVDTSSHADDSTLVTDVMRDASPQLRKAFESASLGGDTGQKRTSIGVVLSDEAEAANPEALALLGRAYEQGLDVPKSRLTGAEYYLRALRLDSPRAYELLWKVAHEQGFAEEMERKAKASDAQAQFVWSGLAAAQIERRTTPEQALGLLQSSADQKHIQAIIELGICYQSGRWVKQDRLQAEDLWKLAAASGNLEAKIRLAALSVSRGEKTDTNLTFLRQTMDMGSIISQVALAYCHEKGFGVSVNKGEAARLYREAAKRGSENAYLALRAMHDEIRPKDKEFQIEE